METSKGVPPPFGEPPPCFTPPPLAADRGRAAGTRSVSESPRSTAELLGKGREGNPSLSPRGITSVEGTEERDFEVPFTRSKTILGFAA